MRCLTCIGGSCSRQGHPAHCAGRPKPIMFSLPQSRSGSICFANLHPSPDCSRSVPCYPCLTPVQKVSPSRSDLDFARSSRPNHSVHAGLEDGKLSAQDAVHARRAGIGFLQFRVRVMLPETPSNSKMVVPCRFQWRSPLPIRRGKGLQRGAFSGLLRR